MDEFEKIIREFQKEYYTEQQPKIPVWPYYQKQPIAKSTDCKVREPISGVKEISNKLSYELDWSFIESMAKRMSKNKGKYPPYNWKRQMDIENLKQALLRHVMEIMKGNYNDEGKNDHFEAIALNAMFIKYQLEHYNNG